MSLYSLHDISSGHVKTNLEGSNARLCPATNVALHTLMLRELEDCYLQLAQNAQK